MYTFESTKKAAPQLFFGCACGILGQNVWPMSRSPCKVSLLQIQSVWHALAIT